MGDKKHTPATVKTRVRVQAVKIHGPNSKLAAEGTREEVQVDEPVQTVEISYDQAVEIFGREAADKLFGKDTA